MYHSGLIKEYVGPKKVDYSKLKDPENEAPKVTPQIPTDEGDDVPSAPDGFIFHRVQNGDTLVGLAVKYSISESKIRRFNSKACFGHRLTHIVGKLMLIPTASGASMSKEVREQIGSIYDEDNERKQNDENIDDKQYSEPDENGKYQLKKAMMYHAMGLDDQRAAYYLGEANWNVRNALKKWREDDIWEKMNRVVKECGVSQEEAHQRLVAHSWNDAAAIKQWVKESKKESSMMAKISKKLGKNVQGETENGIEMNEMKEDEEGTSAATETIETDLGAEVAAKAAPKSNEVKVDDVVSADQITLQ